MKVSKKNRVKVIQVVRVVMQLLRRLRKLEILSSLRILMMIPWLRDQRRLNKIDIKINNRKPKVRQWILLELWRILQEKVKPRLQRRIWRLLIVMLLRRNLYQNNLLILRWVLKENRENLRKIIIEEIILECFKKNRSENSEIFETITSEI